MVKAHTKKCKQYAHPHTYTRHVNNTHTHTKTCKQYAYPHTYTRQHMSDGSRQRNSQRRHRSRQRLLLTRLRSRSKFETRNPKPETRNPRFETLIPNPEPRNFETPNPKPQTPSSQNLCRVFFLLANIGTRTLTSTQRCST